MWTETKLRKAAELLAEKDRIDQRLRRMMGSTNGATGKRKKNLKQHGKYLVAVKKLSPAKRKSLKKVYQEQGVRAAVAAAQKMVEAK